jgi:hypothetical protein
VLGSASKAQPTKPKQKIAKAEKRRFAQTGLADSNQSVIAQPTKPTDAKPINMRDALICEKRLVLTQTANRAPAQMLSRRKIVRV